MFSSKPNLFLKQMVWPSPPHRRRPQVSLYLSDDVSQAGVTQQQPAARGDSVGFVLELLRIHFVEVSKPAGRECWLTRR